MEKQLPDTVVVVGASAGGVGALMELVATFPQRSSAAFFVVLHIPPHTPSQLHTVLQRCTTLPVAAATHDGPMVAGHVYVASADRHLMLTQTEVRLTRGPRECRSRPAIDVLFRSAAAAFGTRAIGVILSGSLDDGTAGLWAIKEAGGVALVQRPDTAEHSSMPQSALQHVDVDKSGTVQEIGQLIAHLVTQPSGTGPTTVPKASTLTELTIAAEGNGLTAGVMDLGKVSKFTCPDCNGVLAEIREGRILRFRCHTGHAFSLKTLLVEVNESIDVGLWSALRAIEERILLLNEIAKLARQGGAEKAFEEADTQAAGARVQAETIRQFLLDKEAIGHLPASPPV